MKAYLKLAVLGAGVLLAASTPVWSADTATCNQRHAVCLQNGGSDMQCLTQWHQCKQPAASPARVSTPVRPAPAPAPAKAPAAPRAGVIKVAVQR